MDSAKPNVTSQGASIDGALAITARGDQCLAAPYTSQPATLVIISGSGVV